MSLIASETQNKVSACRTSLVAVEKHLEPLLKKGSTEVSRNLSSLEHAELQVGLAYSVASLYFCHLLTQGVDPSDHPIRQELDRIQLYFKKVRMTSEEVSAKEVDNDRMRVDVEVAKRIVQHYTSAADAAQQRKAAAASAGATVLPKPGSHESKGEEAKADDDVVQPPQKKLRQESPPSALPKTAAMSESVEHDAKCKTAAMLPEAKAAASIAITPKAPETAVAEALTETAPTGVQTAPGKIPSVKAPVTEASVAKLPPAKAVSKTPANIVTKSTVTVAKVPAPKAPVAKQPATSSVTEAPVTKVALSTAPDVNATVPTATDSKASVPSAAGIKAPATQATLKAQLVPMEPADEEAQATAASLLAGAKADAERAALRKKKKRLASMESLEA